MVGTCMEGAEAGMYCKMAKEVCKEGNSATLSDDTTGRSTKPTHQHQPIRSKQFSCENPGASSASWQCPASQHSHHVPQTATTRKGQGRRLTWFVPGLFRPLLSSPYQGAEVLVPYWLRRLHSDHAAIQPLCTQWIKNTVRIIKTNTKYSDKNGQQNGRKENPIQESKENPPKRNQGEPPQREPNPKESKENPPKNQFLTQHQITRKHLCTQKDKFIA